MPQPRSTTVEAPNAVRRAARCEATESRVACSRPSGVKYIDAASSPNFGTARSRSSAGSARRRAGPGGVSGAETGQCIVGAQRVRLVEGDGEREHVLAVPGLQPRHGSPRPRHPLWHSIDESARIRAGTLRRECASPKYILQSPIHPPTSTKVEADQDSVGQASSPSRTASWSSRSTRSRPPPLACVIPDTAKEKPQEARSAIARVASTTTEPGPARRRDRRQGHLQQVRRHRGQVRRRRAADPRARGPRRSFLNPRSPRPTGRVPRLREIAGLRHTTRLRSDLKESKSQDPRVRRGRPQGAGARRHKLADTVKVTLGPPWPLTSSCTRSGLCPTITNDGYYHRP